MRYRHCFDRLFSHIEAISRLVDTRQVLTKDLDGIDYWLARIANYEYPPDGVTGEEVLQRCVADFGYHGLPRLAKQFGINDWPIYDLASGVDTGA